MLVRILYMEHMGYDSATPQKWVRLNVVYTPKMITWTFFFGNWRQAIGFGLYSIFKHSNKPIYIYVYIYIAKRKQTMYEQQSANQPTLSCDISWLSIQLHNNAATTTIIEMYGHFEPC